MGDRQQLLDDEDEFDQAEDYDDEEEEDEEEESDEEMEEGSDDDLIERDWKRRKASFPTSPAVSYFLTALVVGMMLLTVSLVSLRSISDHYDAVIDNAAVTLRFADWLKLKTDTTLLRAIAPLHTLTGASSVLTEAQSLLTDVRDQISRILPEANRSAGYSLEHCLSKASSDWPTRAAQVDTAHAAFQSQQGDRRVFLNTIHSFGMPKVILTEVGSKGPLLLSTLHQWSADIQTSTVAANATATVDNVLHVTRNVSEVLYQTYLRVHAAEAMTLKTNFALYYGYFPTTTGVDEAEVRLNATLAAVDDLITSYANSSSLLSSGMPMSSLSGDRQLLFAFASNRSLHTLRSDLEGLRSPLLNARILLADQRLLFLTAQQTEGSAFTLSTLPDVGVFLHEQMALPAQTELERCLGNVLAATEPFLQDAKEEAVAVNGHALEFTVQKNGRRNIEIAASVCLGPILIWLLYTTVSLTRQQKTSFFSFKAFTSVNVVLLVLAVGISAGIAGKAISTIETERDISAPLNGLSMGYDDTALKLRIVSVFGEFIQDDYSEEKVNEVVEAVANATRTRVSFTLSADEQRMLDLLQNVGVWRLDAQLHMNVYVYEAFNETLPELRSAYLDAVDAELGSDCMTFAGAVSGLLSTVAFSGVTADVDAALLAAVSHYGMVAASIAAKGGCSDDASVGILWRDERATAPGLWLAGSKPSRYLLNYVTSLDPQNNALLADAASSITQRTRLAEVTSRRAVEGKRKQWYDALVRERRLLVWLTVSCLVLGQLAAWMLSWKVFGAAVTIA